MARSKKSSASKDIKSLLKVFLKPEEYRHKVRIHSVDVEGDIQVYYAIQKIKGVGPTFAKAILKATNISPNKLVGLLSDEEIKQIEDIIENPSKYNIPSWCLNRPRDPETGKDLHYAGSNLVLRVRRDIELMIKIGTWKGLRHKLGLKVRGQRTKTTGRKGLTVGVSKRK